MKKVTLGLLTLACLTAVTMVAAQGTISGIGGVAAKVQGNLGNIAKLLTGASYVAGMAFVIGAIVKFKAHKDNPTQIPIGTPIALLLLGGALMFIPSVFGVAGTTLFGQSGQQAGISGVTSFGGGKKG